MLPGRMGYEDLRRQFRWRIPERFNIGVAIADRWAEREPERLAVLHKRSGGRLERLTFGRLCADANRCANLLRAKGVGRGDRVALMLPQAAETPIAHAAIYKLGAVAVPLAVLFGLEALEYRLANSGARALFTSAASLGKIAEIRARLPELRHVVSIDGPAEGGVLGFHEELARAGDTFEAAATGPDDPALMIFTSGTTGPPKGALHGHRVLLGHLPGVEFAHEFFPQPGDRMWTPAEWAWIGGLLNILLASLYCGVPVVAHKLDKFEPDLAWRLLEELEVRNAFLPPTALKMMRAAPSPRGRHRVALRTLFSGGEAVGRELQDWSRQELGLAINEVYGQTECNLVVESCAAIGVLKPGAIGKPVPGHEVAIIDREGNPLPAGEPGIIAVKRPDPVMFLEYWKRPDATRDKFIGEWLDTGDMGVMDQEGYFSFVGRDDDVITSAGYRIGPGEIEDCLIAHPAVKLAAAVGKPDPLRTEIVKAFIVLNEGYAPSPELAAEIQAYVKVRLAAHEYPREIAFEESLPLTTTGKVMRRLLRDKG